MIVNFEKKSTLISTKTSSGYRAKNTGFHQRHKLVS